MKGLPNLGDEILEFVIGIDVNGSELSILQHFHTPTLIVWGYNEMASFFSQWATFAMVNLLNVMPTEASFTTCRLRRYGSVPFTYLHDPATNVGAHGQCQSINSATCFTWQTEARGYSGRSHNRLPVPADAVADNKRQLHKEYVALYELEGAQYIQNVNDIVMVGLDRPVFVVVSRSSGGVPRAAPAFAPVLSCTVSRHVATLAARVQSTRLSPYG
jgi:hypothetical protein